MGKKLMLLYMLSSVIFLTSCQKEQDFIMEITAQPVPSSSVSEILAEQNTVPDNDYSPFPLSEDIPEILESNTDILLNDPLTMPLPDDYSCLQCISGDLNHDGMADIVVVVEQNHGIDTGSRTLYVMLGAEDGSFKVCWQSNNIMVSGEGGVLGDPFSGVYIEDGTLTISHYGGSSHRWGHSGSYVIRENEMILTKTEELEENIQTGNGTRVIYYPETGVIEERSVTYDGDTFHDLLLFSDTAIPDQIYMIKDVVPDIWGVERNHDPYPPLPSLYGITYGEVVWGSVNLTASEALDLAKNQLYPSFEKESHPYSKEIMDNYSTILAYEVPAYSYVGDNMSLLYIGQSDLWSGDILYHHISAYSLDGEDSKVIMVNDITGEISIKEN